MSNSDLFNSKIKPIPRIRPDLDLIPVQNNGDSYLYFHDMRGYATADFALEYGAQQILSLFDGRKSVNDLEPRLGQNVGANQLLEYVQFLDEHRVLYSPRFKSFAEQYEQQYEASAVHQSVTAGQSYPADPEKLQLFLDDAFEKHGQNDQAFSAKLDNNIEKSSPEGIPLEDSFVIPPHCAQTDVILIRQPAEKRSRNMSSQIKALYAPHIDPRVGMETYVKSFQLLKNLTPKRVVILATSHHSSLHANLYENNPFIVSEKDFEMPMGTVRNDKKAVEKLRQSSNECGLSDRDRAHRIEHSIELHLLFLQYIWNHEFSIVPIVVGGFDELFYMEEGHLGKQIDNFAEHLHDQFGSDEETLFLISGDMAHVGKKFGDDRPAVMMQKEVEKFDEQFLWAGTNGSTKRMLQLMKRNYDPYHICGFPPLYTFLKAFPQLKGEVVSYNRWDETERESAVTFSSILYK